MSRAFQNREMKLTENSENNRPKSPQQALNINYQTLETCKRIGPYILGKTLGIGTSGNNNTMFLSTQI